MTGKPEQLFYRIGHNLLPITHLFDINGDETHDKGSACSALTLLPDGRWMAIQLAAGEIESAKLN